MKLALSIYQTTTSAADDDNLDGPEFVGRVLCLTIGRLALEFTIAWRAA